MKRQFCFAFMAILMLVIVSCEDTTEVWAPVPNVWTTVVTNADFGFSKIWDGAGNDAMRICAYDSAALIEKGNIIYYNPSTNKAGQLALIHKGADFLDISGLDRWNQWIAASDSIPTTYGQVWYYNGITTSNYTETIYGPAPGTIPLRLYGVCVFMDGATEHRVFVGENGFVLHYEEASGGNLGGTEDGWHASAVSGNEDLYSVWGTDTGHLWAVGAGGVVYEYSGAFTWTKVFTHPSNFDFNDIHGYEVGAAVYWYAVTELNTMYFYNNGGNPTAVAIPASGVHLYAVFMLNANRGIAVGQNGHVIELDTGVWTQTNGVTTIDCRGCFISADDKNTYVATTSATYDGSLIRLYEP